MNFFLWALAGAALGWVAFSMLRLNSGRSLIVSILIGTFGGFLGGKILAPVFAAAPTVPPSTDFAMVPLVFAVLTAVVFLVAADQALKRWDV